MRFGRILVCIKAILRLLGQSRGRLGAILGWFGGRLGDVWGEVTGCLLASEVVSVMLWSVWSPIFVPSQSIPSWIPLCTRFVMDLA